MDLDEELLALAATTTGAGGGGEMPLSVSASAAAKKRTSTNSLGDRGGAGAAGASKQRKRVRKRQRSSSSDDDDDEESEYSDYGGGANKGKSSSSSAAAAARGKRASNIYSDSEDDFGRGSANDSDDDDDMDDGYDEEDSGRFAEARKWGADLIGDEADRMRLNKMTEIERESILAERAETRRNMLERMELKRRLKQQSQFQNKKRKSSDKPDTRKSARRVSDKDKKNKSLNALRDKRQRKKGGENIQYSDDDDDEEDGQLYGIEYDSDKEASATAAAVVLTYTDFLKIQITRTQCANWCHTSFFEETVKGCLVRIGLGMDPVTKKLDYRVAIVDEIIDYHKAYEIEGVPVKLALRVQHGKSKRVVQMNPISNSRFTEAEFNRFAKAMQHDKIPLPKPSALTKRMESLQKAINYIFTDEEIQDMVRTKNELRSVPTNIAKEMTELQRRRAIAVQRGHGADILSLDEQIVLLEEFAGKHRKTNAKLDKFEKINQRNRMLNRMDTKEAEKISLEMRMNRKEKRPSITSRRRSSAISDDLISPLNQDAALPITLDQIDESTADHEINLDEFDEEGFFLTVDLSAIEAELVAVR